MIISAFGETQFGHPLMFDEGVRHRVPSRIAQVALEEAKTMDRLWAALGHSTLRPTRSRHHKHFVSEYLAFFFSVTESFLRQSLPRINETFLELLADNTCLHALSDPFIPKPYAFIGEFPNRRYRRYRDTVMTRRVELWQVHPYATISSLADFSAEHLVEEAWAPASMKRHLGDVLRTRLQWAGSELIGNS